MNSQINLKMRTLLLLVGTVSLVLIAKAKPQNITPIGNSGNNWQNGDHEREFDQFYISFPLKANWYHAFETCQAKKSLLISIDSKSKQELVNKYIKSLKLSNGK